MGKKHGVEKKYCSTSFNKRYVYRIIDLSPVSLEFILTLDQNAYTRANVRRTWKKMVTNNTTRFCSF